jgi:hypothetical protein
MRIPFITANEWRSIAPLLPPTNGPSKPRLDDRLYVSAFWKICRWPMAIRDHSEPCGNAGSVTARLAN